MWDGIAGRPTSNCNCDSIPIFNHMPQRTQNRSIWKFLSKNKTILTKPIPLISLLPYGLVTLFSFWTGNKQQVAVIKLQQQCNIRAICTTRPKNKISTNFKHHGLVLKTCMKTMYLYLYLYVIDKSWIECRDGHLLSVKVMWRILRFLYRVG